jgi:hypothetical protein
MARFSANDSAGAARLSWERERERGTTKRTQVALIANQKLCHVNLRVIFNFLQPLLNVHEGVALSHIVTAESKQCRAVDKAG